ncbi:MAG TPA: hypothetical protein VKV95_04455 [Terriglobia bacterium]|nr:hypothetical protein [Terriglobia bacterium]
MNAAEIIVHRKQAHGSLQMQQALAEAIGEPRESPQVHPYSQVGAFDHTYRDVVKVRVSHNWVWNRLDNFSWAVPMARLIKSATLDSPNTRNYKRLILISFWSILLIVFGHNETLSPHPHTAHQKRSILCAA